jgi:phytanoyl-CoA hydroxylase
MNDETLIKQYETDGFVVLRQFLPAHLVLGMMQAINQIVEALIQQRTATDEEKQQYAKEMFDTKFNKVFEKDPNNAPIEFTNELHTNAFYNVIFYEPLLAIAVSVLGDEIRLAPGYFLRPKAFPDDRFQSLWHQDPAYLLLGNQGFEKEAFDQIRTMNVWMPLVPVNQENGCMQFLPGTHTNGMAPHHPQPPYNYLEIDRAVLDPALQSGDVVDITLDPGDVVLFNTLLYHQGQDNQSKHARWSVDFRYQDARQPTLIDLHGHLIRSRLSPELTVGSKENWRNLAVT